MEWSKVLKLMCSIHRIYSKENVSFTTSKINDQFPETTSLRISNILRDVLNQDSLVRLSVVQKIQSLAMDSMDQKSKMESFMNNLKGLKSEMKSLKTKYEQQEERIAVLDEENVKLNENIRQLMQYQDGERNRSLLLEQNAIKIFMENEEFQAFWNHTKEIFTRFTKVVETVQDVSIAFNKTVTKKEVYFTAGIVEDINNKWNEGGIIIFPHVISNVGGGYNATNGIFTAPHDGVFVFTFFLAPYRREMKGHLVVNGHPKVGVHETRIRSIGGSVGNSAVIPLVQDDRVWVELISGTSVLTDAIAPMCTFSGFSL